MKRLGLMLLILLSCADAAEYGVITNPQSGIDRIDPRQLRDLFLQKRRFIGTQKAIPVNLLADNMARIAFESEVLKMNRDTLNGYWIKQHFQGIVPPVTQSSFASVKLFVRNVEGAIGYIPLELVDKDVKVLYEF
jgi:hypothetical protein